MKITGTPNTSGTPGTTSVAASDHGAGEVRATAQPAGDAPLQSAALAPAKEALAALPDIDQARVTALRDALAKGELPFDASRLAGLIDRYHGGHS
ncbi:MAG: flagellar biosynthesis anti-sigma factor FlgM [Rhodocyclaceae bacterium]